MQYVHFNRRIKILATRRFYVWYPPPNPSARWGRGFSWQFDFNRTAVDEDYGVPGILINWLPFFVFYFSIWWFFVRPLYALERKLDAFIDRLGPAGDSTGNEE